MIKVDEVFFSYAVFEDKQESCDIAIKELKFDRSFPVPIFEMYQENCVLNRNIEERDDNFWYRDAGHIIRNKYHQQVVQKKRMPGEDNRNTIANVEMYNGEVEYIEQKIMQNVPKNIKLNCTGITNLSINMSAERTAFVAFFGSGNHMMR